MGDYEITYPEVRESGSGFQVHSVIKQEAKALDAHVVYHLYQKDLHWKIDDIILDDVSLIEDLKYQFDKIVTEANFSALLDKMRGRLAAAEKENKGAV